MKFFKTYQSASKSLQKKWGNWQGTQSQI